MLQLSHKKLDVYQFTLKLVNNVYEITRTFPVEERYLIVNQMRRAAISVCSNLAEGAARKSKQEKRRFFEISRSSLVEIDTQFEISLILGYAKNEELKELNGYVESVFRMLSKMISYLENETPH